MKRYKKIMVDVMSDIVCDICDESCSEPQSGLIEYAVLEALWGYYSKKDGERYECMMCEDCFDKIVSFIDSIKKPSV